MGKELLFSLTKKDFEIETFCTGGPGGQNQNKVHTGVRVRHPASGAVAESRVYNSQYANKKAAFMKLTQSDTFRRWHRTETARKLGMIADVGAEVERMMAPRNLRIEGQKDGRWVPIEDTGDHE